jgi:hypothetical protein
MAEKRRCKDCGQSLNLVKMKSGFGWVHSGKIQREFCKEKKRERKRKQMELFK